MTAKGHVCASASAAKPAWIRVRAGHGAAYQETLRRLRDLKLHTVCEAALCPNQGHCWSHGHVTILILGDACTRGCRFCHVDKRPVAPPDPDEPAHVAAAVRAGGLKAIVLTSVTRDDLPDGGAAIWAETIQRVHADAPGVEVEVLVPDFGGNRDAWQKVCESRPEVFGHNLETVPRLYAEVRPQADYRLSLDVLRFATEFGLITKTSLMLGMGETRDEIETVMRDARQAGVTIFYAGQYLQPTRAHLPVVRYLTPAAFDEIGALARAMGFARVACAPLVRSSYLLADSGVRQE
jgi:lipoic acid synthetase